MPTISVIVPIYKVEKYVKKCVDSIINQTWKNLEIILVDDGSPDCCPEICDEYAELDDRIIVIHQKNHGLSAARNAGIDIASGEYIGFVDSDDFIAPNMYEQLYTALDSAHAQLAICDFAYIDEDGTILPDYSPIQEEVLDNYRCLEKIGRDKNWYYVVAWNKLYQKSVFDSIRFPEGKLHEDNFIIHEIIYSCKIIVTIPKSLYFYMQRKNSIMNSGYKIERFDEIESLYYRYQFYKDNDLKYLYRDLGELMWEKYANIRTHIHLKNKGDLIRAKNIDSMFREVCYSCLEIDRGIRCLKYLIPRFYYICKQQKLKVLRRTKFLLCFIKHICLNWNTEFYLVNTPTHGNLGDHAIVLAERQLLQDFFLKHTELTVQQLDYHEKYYARVIPKNRIIAIHGGGYLGMLWPMEEYRFRRILKAFHNHKVVVFPQTVTFDMTTDVGRTFFEESKKIYYTHPNLTIFVREKQSYEFMRKYMQNLNVQMVPDIVTLLRNPPISQKRNNILLCMRKDHEKCLSIEDCQYIVNILHKKYPSWKINETDTVLSQQIMPKERARLVYGKLLQFSQAHLVVTDRLHGMIFSALTSTPCIALGNSNGKVKNVYEWIKQNHYIYYLDDPKQIECILHKLDFEQTYCYQRDYIEKAFIPLIEFLQKK